MSTRARRVGSEFVGHVAFFGSSFPDIEFPIRRSPGYGLTLLSLSTTSALHAAETLSTPPPAPAKTNSMVSTEPSAATNTFQTPEDLALHASRLLLEQIGRGGCIDEAHQWLVMLMMVLGKEDVGRCKMGKLTAHS